jgi:hypothetical protein
VWAVAKSGARASELGLVSGEMADDVVSLVVCEEFRDELAGFAISSDEISGLFLGHRSWDATALAAVEESCAEACGIPRSLSDMVVDAAASAARRLRLMGAGGLKCVVCVPAVQASAERVAQVSLGQQAEESQQAAQAQQAA